MKSFPFARPRACCIFCLIYISLTLAIAVIIYLVKSHFSPSMDYELLTIENLGELGSEARVEMTPIDYIVAETMFDVYQYNAWLSERIPLKRSLRDYRDPRCLNVTPNLKDSITASIIIAHSLEHPQTLLRTLYSIQSRTPSNFIKEVILVHDGPGHTNLSEYISYNLPLVIQLEVGALEPKGLIQARLAGARNATGDVLVFLNAHMEVTQGWLPPLLTPILENQQTVTQPIMDTVSTETFAYEELVVPDQIGFNWRLDRIAMPLDKRSKRRLPRSYASSQLEGHVIAINRQWFWHLGGWDEGLEDNGGDALELSLKVWQCGGRILTVPCSRIGLVSKRDETTAQCSPNLNPDERVRKNFMRIVEVWFDNYKFKVYRYSPRLRNISAGSLTKQRKLRRRLHCKSFEWYRNQVVPNFRQHYLNKGLANFAVGKIKPYLTHEYCLSLRRKRPILGKCNSSSLEDWTLTHFCQLKNGDVCLKRGRHGKVLASRCTKALLDDPWSYNYRNRTFVSNGNKCLQIDIETFELIATTCDDKLKEQHWNYSGVQGRKLSNIMDICLNINL